MAFRVIAFLACVVASQAAYTWFNDEFFDVNGAQVAEPDCQYGLSDTARTWHNARDNCRNRGTNKYPHSYFYAETYNDASGALEHNFVSPKMFNYYQSSSGKDYWLGGKTKYLGGNTWGPAWKWSLSPTTWPTPTATSPHAYWTVPYTPPASGSSLKCSRVSNAGPGVGGTYYAEDCDVEAFYACKRCKNPVVPSF